eukprot:767159-Hanusia_phi.AAC.4
MASRLQAMVAILSMLTTNSLQVHAERLSFVGICPPSHPVACVDGKISVPAMKTFRLKQSSSNQVLMRVHDRRSFLGKIFRSVPAIYFGLERIEVARAEYDTRSLPASLQKLMGEFPLEDATIAIFDDNSKLVDKMFKELQAKGIQAIRISTNGDLATMRNKYRENECYAAIVPDNTFVKKVMAGRGLECDHCSFYGDSAPPKWIVVVQANGKDGKTIQSESELLGRECDPSGICYQSGTPIPIFTLEELPALK